MNRKISVAVGILLLCQAGVGFGSMISFSGQLDLVLTDNGLATYSGVPVGTPFNGALTYGTEAQSTPDVVVPGDYDFDVPFGGFISNGAITRSGVGALQVSIRDDMTIDQDTADILNALYPSSSFAANDQLDTVDIDVGISTPANGELVFGITYFTTDLGTITGTGFSNLTPTLFDSGNLFFFINEMDASGSEIYEGFGVVDNVSVVPAPSAAILVILGLSATGMRLRRGKGH